MAQIDDLYSALKKADAAGDKAGAQKLADYIRALPADQQSSPIANEPAAQGPGMAESLGAGLGRGVGQVALGAQNLVGKGVSAVGGLFHGAKTLSELVTPQPNMVEQAGQWLQNDAKTGQAALDAQNAPYKAANPITNAVGTTAGEIIPTLPVGGVIARGLSAVPGVAAAAPNMLNAIRTSGMTAGATSPVTNTLLRLGGGAVTGGASAALVNPDDAKTGAIVGAITPAAVRLAGGVGQSIGGTIQGLAEPLYDAGRNAIVGRALNRAAGADAPAVAARLEAAAQPFVGPSQGAQRATMGELVPGSVPTVGQAAGNAGVASLERAATSTSPEMTNAVADRLRSQNQARVDLLQGLTGADGGRDFAVANRSGTADQLYGAARQNGFPAQALTPAAQANIAAMQARIPKSIIDDAKQLASIDGHPMNNTTSIEGLQYIKQGIDSAISKAKASGDGTLAAKLTSLQKDYLAGLDQLSPDLKAARLQFAKDSVPINEMDTAQRLADRSIDPLTGTLRPSNFARNFNDRTAQQATGFPGSTLENTFSNQNLNGLNGLLADVQRATTATNSAGSAGSDTVKKLAYTNILDQAGVPSFLRDMKGLQIPGNLLARGADAVYAPANRDIQNRLAQAMLDPGTAAQLMRQATPAQRNLLLQLATPVVQLGYRAAPVAVSGP